MATSRVMRNKVSQHVGHTHNIVEQGFGNNYAHMPRAWREHGHGRGVGDCEEQANTAVLTLVVFGWRIGVDLK